MNAGHFGDSGGKWVDNIICVITAAEMLRSYRVVSSQTVRTKLKKT